MGVNHQEGPWWVPSKLFRISRLLCNSLDDLQFKSKKKSERKERGGKKEKKTIQVSHTPKGGPTSIAKGEILEFGKSYSSTSGAQEWKRKRRKIKKVQSKSSSKDRSPKKGGPTINGTRTI
eukprot:TRINITY_DN17597_c0_g3_i5.p1 TRINITY_DN17597_c0_g3~~TRINITY_DN17597_c0_g3_i5.p1  ORF type:complete len:121 (+),score=23.03 TRINITY_DN17597_c0_g3_i5:167-529(+)